MAGSMRGVIMTVGVTGVMAGEGPSDRIGSLSGLSNETSSVASDNRTEHNRMGLNPRHSMLYLCLLLFHLNKVKTS